MKWIVEAESIDDIVLGKYVVRMDPLTECKDCQYYGHGCAMLFPKDGYCYDGKRRKDDTD